MKVLDVELDKITPYSGNPRQISVEAIEKVAKSINDFGFQQPIVVDSNYVIIVGHTRHAAAGMLGLTTVPVVVAGSLTDAQVAAYRLADNRVAEESRWDYLALYDELTRLEELGGDDVLLSTGFDSDELVRFMTPLDEKEDIEIEDNIPQNPLSYRIKFDNEKQLQTWLDFIAKLEELPGKNSLQAKIIDAVRDYVWRSG